MVILLVIGVFFVSISCWNNNYELIAFPNSSRFFPQTDATELETQSMVRRVWNYFYLKSTELVICKLLLKKTQHIQVRFGFYSPN